MKDVDSWKYTVTVLGSLCTFLFGGWDTIINVLVVLIVIDFITGMGKAYVSGTVNSHKGSKGLIKKGSIFLVIILANMLDLLVSNGTPTIRTVVIYFYIVNEGTSIVENLGLMGVPLPPILYEKFEQLKSKKP